MDWSVEEQIPTSFSAASKIAFVEFGGVKQKARIDLMPDIQLDDYVLVHAGYAIEKLSEQAAKESLEAWDELLDVLDEEDRERAESMD